MAKKIVLSGLRPDQLAVIQDKHREKVVACGRKWGKTTTAMYFVVHRNFLLGRNKIIWWVMPSYTQCRDVQREFKTIFGGSGIIKRAPQRPEFGIVFSNGSLLLFKSADKPDYLRGANPHLAVIDEARDINDDAWYAVIRPNLAARKAETLIISTPKKNHWFEKEYLRGQSDEFPDTISWNYPTWNNPYMVEEAQSLKQELPENVWKQEVAAEFVDEYGGVFDHLEYVVDDNLPIQSMPEPNKQYFMGVDLAVKRDFTAVVVIDNFGVVKYVERFNKVTWQTVESKIQAIASMFDATVYVDSTGVGDPIYEMLKNKWVKTEPFIFTGNSKQMLIERLILTIGRREILLPPHEELLDEMLSLRYDINKRGNITYAAPPNKHDDLVMALGLAVYGLSQNKGHGSFKTTKIILPNKGF